MTQQLEESEGEAARLQAMLRQAMAEGREAARAAEERGAEAARARRRVAGLQRALEAATQARGRVGAWWVGVRLRG